MKMQSFILVLRVTFLAWIFCTLNSSLAKDGKDEVRLQRIGGMFKVKSIEHLPNGKFKVLFASEPGAGPFEELELESEHVHAGVSEGTTLRLSADVQAIQGKRARVDQVVLFLKGRQGETPVWMMSRSKNHFAPPARLLEMHAPANDYQVF